MLQTFYCLNRINLFSWNSRAIFWVVLCLFMLPCTVFAQGTDFFYDPEPPSLPKPPQVPVSPALQVVPPKPKPSAQKVPEKKKQRSISDVIFLMDISGSMEEYVMDESLSKLEASQKALSYFVENMHQGSRFLFWTFSNRVTKYPITTKGRLTRSFQPIGKKNSQVRQEWKRNINQLQTEGGTSLYEAVYQALRYFDSQQYQAPRDVKRRKIIVVLADGQDDGLSTIRLAHILHEKQKLRDVAVKTIGFGIAPNSPAHQEICQLASDRQSCLLTQEPKKNMAIIKQVVELLQH